MRFFDQGRRLPLSERAPYPPSITRIAIAERGLRAVDADRGAGAGTPNSGGRSNAPPLPQIRIRDCRRTSARL
jgi:hypothetical protein